MTRPSWRPTPPDGDGLEHRLTPSQAATLALVARGYSDAEIARRYGRTLDCVRRHMAGAIRALGAKSRAHAVALAVSGRARIAIHDGRRKGKV